MPSTSTFVTVQMTSLLGSQTTLSDPFNMEDYRKYPVLCSPPRVHMDSTGSLVINFFEIGSFIILVTCMEEMTHELLLILNVTCGFN